MSAKVLLGFAATALLATALTAHAATPEDDADIGVNVRQHGNRIAVDVDIPVKATAIEAWNVITDYDNMPKFVTSLQSSKVLERNGNTVILYQKGVASRGPLSITFENIREIVLTPPTQIQSRLISGDLEESDFTTHVVDHGDSSRIVNHGEFIPKMWVPPIIGPMLIEAETRTQFQELRAEIMRRRAEAATARQ
jgi:uncharacterized membrane protein